MTEHSVPKVRVLRRTAPPEAGRSPPEWGEATIRYHQTNGVVSCVRTRLR